MIRQLLIGGRTTQSGIKLTRGAYDKYAEVDDIVNEGVIALIKAVETYDLQKGVKFETYAAILISLYQ